MDQKETYQGLITEIIAKQAVILGPDIAILKARNVSEIVISSDGKITEIKGDPQQAVEKLVNEYIELSGQIVKNTLKSVFAKYEVVDNSGAK